MGYLDYLIFFVWNRTKLLIFKNIYKKLSLSGGRGGGVSDKSLIVINT